MTGLSRYAAVGLVATACHYGLLVVLVELDLSSAGLAALAGSLVGALVAYWGNRRYTFAKTDAPHRRALPKFAAVAGVGAIVNALIVGGGVAWGAHYLIMQAVATAVVMLGTFHLNRLWTFPSQP